MGERRVETVERPTISKPDEGDHDKFAHIVIPKEAVTRAYVTGEAVIALCGKRWVPTRDPTVYPICPTCKEVYSAHFGHGP